MCKRYKPEEIVITNDRTFTLPFSLQAIHSAFFPMEGSKNAEKEAAIGEGRGEYVYKALINRLIIDTNHDVGTVYPSIFANSPDYLYAKIIKACDAKLSIKDDGHSECVIKYIKENGSEFFPGSKEQTQLVRTFFADADRIIHADKKSISREIMHNVKTKKDRTINKKEKDSYIKNQREKFGDGLIGFKIEYFEYIDDVKVWDKIEKLDSSLKKTNTYITKIGRKKSKFASFVNGAKNEAKVVYTQDASEEDLVNNFIIITTIFKEGKKYDESKLKKYVNTIKEHVISAYEDTSVGDFKRTVCDIIDASLQGTVLASPDKGKTYAVCPPCEIIACFNQIHDFLDSYNPDDDQKRAIFFLLVMSALLLDQFDLSLPSISEYIEKIIPTNKSVLDSSSAHGSHINSADIPVLNTYNWIKNKSDASLKSLNSEISRFLDIPEWLSNATEKPIVLFAPPGAGKTTAAFLKVKKEKDGNPKVHCVYIDASSREKIYNSLGIAGFTDALSDHKKIICERLDEIIKAMKHGGPSTPYFIVDNFNDGTSNSLGKTLIDYLRDKKSKTIVCSQLGFDKLNDIWMFDRINIRNRPFSYFDAESEKDILEKYRKLMKLSDQEELKKVEQYAKGNISIALLIKQIKRQQKDKPWEDMFDSNIDDSFNFPSEGTYLDAYFRELLSHDSSISRLLACAAVLSNSSIDHLDILHNILEKEYGKMERTLLEAELEQGLYFNRSEGGYCLNRCFRPVILRILTPAQKRRYISLLIEFLREKLNTMLSYSEEELAETSKYIGYIDHLRDNLDDATKATVLDLFLHAASYNLCYSHDVDAYNLYYETIVSAKPADNLNIFAKLLFLSQYFYGKQHFGIALDGDVPCDEFVEASVYQSELLPEPLASMLKCSVCNTAAVTLLHEGGTSNQGFCLNKSVSEYLSLSAELSSEESMRKAYFTHGTDHITRQYFLFLGEQRRITACTQSRYSTLTGNKLSEDPQNEEYYRTHRTRLSNQIQPPSDDTYKSLDLYLKASRASYYYEKSSIDYLLKSISMLSEVLREYKQQNEQNEPIWYYTALMDLSYVLRRFGEWLLSNTPEKQQLDIIKKSTLDSLWTNISPKENPFIKEFPDPTVKENEHTLLAFKLFSKCRNILCFVEEKLREFRKAREEMKAYSYLLTDLHQYHALLAWHVTKLYTDTKTRHEIAQNALASIDEAINQTQSEKLWYRYYLFLCYRGLIFIRMEYFRHAMIDITKALNEDKINSFNHEYFKRKLNLAVDRIDSGKLTDEPSDDSYVTDNELRAILDEAHRILCNKD